MELFITSLLEIRMYFLSDVHFLFRFVLDFKVQNGSFSSEQTKQIVLGFVEKEQNGIYRQESEHIVPRKKEHCSFPFLYNVMLKFLRKMLQFL